MVRLKHEVTALKRARLLTQAIAAAKQVFYKFQIPPGKLELAEFYIANAIEQYSHETSGLNVVNAVSGGGGPVSQESRPSRRLYRPPQIPEVALHRQARTAGFLWQEPTSSQH